MRIKVLGENPDVKGKSFEKLMVTILDRLGYDDIITRIHTTGMELDIEAKHKVTKNPLICECKAFDQPIGTSHLTDFLGKIVHEETDTITPDGKFFSLSGFIGTASKWYDELKPTTKERFKIYGNEGVISLLNDSGLLLPSEHIDKIIRKNTEYSLGERYGVFFESYLYIVQILKIGGSASHYIILTAEGEIVHKTIEEAVVKLDETLQSLTRIDLAILEKVTLNLLETKECF